VELASYYLVSSGTDLESAVKVVSDFGSPTKPKYDFAGDFALTSQATGEILMKGFTFCRQEPRPPPSWYDLFRVLTEETLADRYQGSSHAGILIAEVAGRIWALAFGHSYRDVEELPVEMRFGRITISNAIDNVEALRGFVGQTFGPNAKTRIESTNRDGPLDRLSFLEESNRLRKLRAKITFGGEEFAIEGGTGLRFPRAETSDQLLAILRQLSRWWNNGGELRPEIADKDPVFKIPEGKRTVLYEAEYESALLSGNIASFFLSFDLEEAWCASKYSLKVGTDWLADIALPDTSLVLQTARQFDLSPLD
jgi:hypothetical protein